MINQQELMAFAPKMGELILFTPPPGASPQAVYNCLRFLEKVFPDNLAIAMLPGQELTTLPMDVVAKLMERSMKQAELDRILQLEQHQEAKSE